MPLQVRGNPIWLSAKIVPFIEILSRREQSRRTLFLSKILDSTKDIMQNSPCGEFLFILGEPIHKATLED